MPMSVGGCSKKSAAKWCPGLRKKRLLAKSARSNERKPSAASCIGGANPTHIQFFRDEIQKAYGGRAPRVLDPFAGGGAIPLEAMRLGCEVTASDINPVAWFILKCTL